MWRERMTQKHIFWPTAFGVKDAKGEWLDVYVDRTRAKKVFDTNPAAKQLIGELDALLGDEVPGVILEERK